MRGIFPRGMKAPLDRLVLVRGGGRYLSFSIREVNICLKDHGFDSYNNQTSDHRQRWTSILASFATRYGNVRSRDRRHRRRRRDLRRARYEFEECVGSIGPFLMFPSKTDGSLRPRVFAGQELVRGSSRRNQTFAAPRTSSRMPLKGCVTDTSTSLKEGDESGKKRGMHK